MSEPFDPVIAAEYEHDEPLPLLRAQFWRFLRDSGFAVTPHDTGMMVHPTAHQAVSYINDPVAASFVFADVRGPVAWGVISLTPAAHGTRVVLTRTVAEVRYGELLDHYWQTFAHAITALAPTPVSAA